MREVSIRTIVDGEIEGEALVSTIPISFLGGIDADTGIITDPENSLFGESIKGKIFVFPEGAGSTVGSYVIYGLTINDVAPLAMIANQAETIVIAGAVLADIPLVDQPGENIIENIKSGDIIRIDTNKGVIEIK